jgi:hypothetical protein
VSAARNNSSQPFSNIGGVKAQALYVIEDALFFAQRATLLGLTAAA